MPRKFGIAGLLLAGCASFPWLEAGAGEAAPWGPDSPETAAIRRDTDIEASDSAGALLMGMIRFYQKVLRPALDADCPFEPSCSNYALESIARYGAFQGLLMTADRLERCHPLNNGDYPRSRLGRLDDPPRANSLEGAPNSLSGDVGAARPPSHFREVSADRDPLESFSQGSPSLKRLADGTKKRLSEAPETERWLFRFALNLFFQGDYYRAVTEWKRFESYHRPSSLVPDARFLSAVAALYAGRAKEASDILGRAFPWSDSERRAAASYLEGYALYLLRRFDECRDRLRRATGEPAWEREAAHLSILSRIAEGEYVWARREVESHPELPGAEALARILERAGDLPSRSPAIAGGLSALLPGSGQVYAGRPWDGFISLLLTGAFGAATWEASRENLPVAAGIAGAIGLVFYTGNVYGGINAARRYNAETEASFQREAREATRGPLSFWELDRGRPDTFRPFDLER